MKDELNASIRRGLKSLADEPVQTSHQDRTMTLLRNRQTKEFSMKPTVRRSAFAGALLIAGVAAMLLIPVSYTVTVGSLATLRFTPNAGVKPMEVVEALAIPNTQKIMSLENAEAIITIAARKQDAQKLESSIRSLLKPFDGKLQNFNLKVEPITERHGGNALAAMTGGKIVIGVEGLSDSDIEARIAEALSAHGLQVRNVQVQTTTTSPGHIQRRIEVKAEGNGEGDLQELQIGDDANNGGNRQEEKVIVKTK